MDLCVSYCIYHHQHHYQGCGSVLMGRQFLLDTDIQVAGVRGPVAGVGAARAGEVEGRGRIAGLGGALGQAGHRRGGVGRHGDGGVVLGARHAPHAGVVAPPLEVGGVGGRGRVAVVGRLRHPPALVVAGIVAGAGSPGPAGVGAVAVRGSEAVWAGGTSELWGRGAAVRPGPEVRREHVVRRRREVPGTHRTAAQTVGAGRAAEEWSRRSVGVRREGHPHVRREASPSDELHLVDSLLLAPLVLEPDLDHAHRQTRVLRQLLPHLTCRLGVLVETCF